MDGSFIAVQANHGPVKGIFHQNTDQSKVPHYSFTGIPYAIPPIGELRFKPPKPIEPWTEPVDATKPSKICAQLNLRTKQVIGSEDCLYLDVFTPCLNPTSKLPVIFWINGFSFMFIDNRPFGPRYLLEQNVVVVYCMYRVGSLGFLTTCEPTAPGNCGLKDIVVALKWVRLNIESFGGDSNCVTLMGTSSGATMVQFMMLSPMAAGLFHRVILQSGILNLYGYMASPKLLVAIKLAQILGFSSSNLDDVIDFLRTVSVEDLIKAQEELAPIKPGFGYYLNFFPCVENEFEGEVAFITKYPRTIKSGAFNRVPVLVGLNSNEWQKLASTQKEALDKHVELINSDQGNLFANVANRFNSTSIKMFSGKFLQFYIKGVNVKQENISDIINIHSDILMNYFINDYVKLHVKANVCTPLYYYVFDVMTDCNILELFGESLPMHLGMSQGDELGMLFDIPSSRQKSKDFLLLRKRMLKLWINFAKFGNPTPQEDPTLQVKWEPVVDPDKLKYLNINSELTVGQNPFYERMTFIDHSFSECSVQRLASIFDNIV